MYDYLNIVNLAFWWWMSVFDFVHYYYKRSNIDNLSKLCQMSIFSLGLANKGLNNKKKIYLEQLLENLQFY